jgi:protein TonB
MSLDRTVGLVFVVGIHALALYGLWSYRILPTPADALTVFVNFINPPPPVEKPPPPPPKPVKLEKPRLIEPPRPQQLVVEAPVVSPAEAVAPAPPKEPPPVIVAAAPAPPATPPKPAGPVTLAEELSVACPNRVPPVYPIFSRRAGEQGRVVLRVELDERGSVTQASIASSSGLPRLDEAALSAVRQWRCNPASRGGVPVRAVALQPFNFVLEGR